MDRPHVAIIIICGFVVALVVSQTHVNCIISENSWISFSQNFMENENSSQFHVHNFYVAFIWSQANQYVISH